MANLRRKFVSFFIFILFTLPGASAFAGKAVPHLLPFQGRLTNASGVPVNYPVTVKFRIYPPTGTCYLYEDTQNITPSTYGIFSTLLGGPGNSSGPTNAFAQVFNNDVASLPDSCAGSYVPATNDWRRIEIVVDGDVSPDMQTIGASPFAINSNFLEGKSASQFVQIQGNLTQANAEVLVGGGDASSLHNHDSIYVKVDGSNNFTGNVGTSADIYTTTGKVGVGTATANADLDILKNSPTMRLGSISGSGGTSKIDFYSGTTTQRASIQSSETTNVLKFFTGSSEALRLDASQNAIFAGSIQVAGTISSGKYTDTQETTLVTALTALGTVATGTLWTNTTSQKLKYWDGAQVQILTNGASVVSTITAGTGINLTGTSTNPIINVTYGTTAGTAIEGNASFGGDVSGAYNGLTVNKLKGKSLASGAPSTMGQIYFYNSVADEWKLSQGAAPTDGQILKWNDTAKIWAPAADAGWIAVDATAAVKGIMRIGSGLVDGGSGLVNADFTTTGQSNKILALDGSGVANAKGLGLINTGTVTLSAQTASATYGLKLPAAAPSANQSLKSDGSGNLSWVTYLSAVTDSALLANGKIWVGNSSGIASETTLDDTTKLPLAGGTMTGAIAMGAQNITNTGNISMAANKYFGLSANSTNGTVAGQMWYDSGTIKYFDGSIVKSLALTGDGIISINGLTAGTQAFAIGTSGTAPAYVSATSTHTLNIPMASTASVTAGLLSKTDYDSFAAKQSASLPSARVWVGNGSGVATAVDLSGDATVNNAGVVTIANSAVTDAKVATGIAATKIGGGAIDNTEYSYLDGVTSAIQTQFAGKIDNNLASGKILIGNASNLTEAFTISGDATISNAGALTLASTITAGTKGLSNKVAQITYDAKGRITAVTEVTVDDTTKLPLTGGTLTGTLTTASITMAANKYFGLSANSTNGTIAGQMWYDTGTIKYFDGSTVKSLGLAGSGITSMNGLTGGTQTFANGTSGTAPAFSSSGTIHTLDIPMAATTSVTAGLLSKTDYDIFNAKQTASLASTKVWVGNSSGIAAPVSLSGDATIANTGAVTVDKTATGTSSKILALDGSGVANAYGVGIKGATSGTATLQTLANFTNYTLTLPADDGTANQVLSTDGSGVLSWVTPLSSVNNSAALTTNKIWVGNASNKAIEVDLSGDATISASGALTLSSVVTAATKGDAQKVPQVSYDAKGRITAISEVTIDDTTKLPLAGGTLTGTLTTDNITMAANKYLGLSANSTDGTVAGQLWYDTGTIKYFDGSVVKSLGVAGAGITNINGLTSGTQTFAIGTAGTAPAISSATSTHTLNIPMAATASVTAGLLSKTDYDSFAAKQSASLASAKVWVGNGSGVAAPIDLSGDVTITNAGVATIDKTQAAAASKILQLTASSIAVTKGVDVGGAGAGVGSLRYPNTATNTTLTLPSTTGSANQFLQTDGSGALSWSSSLTAITNSATLNDGKLWMGNSSNKAMEVTVSGDATIDNVGALTLKNTGTAGTYGSASLVPIVTTDAQGRVTGVTTAAPLDATKLPLTGGTLTGTLTTASITMAANKYLELSANTTDGTVAGQLWYDTGTIKYFDGTSVKSLGLAGSGITSMNGLTGGTQTFANGTSGTAPAFSSSGTIHTLDIPLASTASVTAGLLSKTDYDSFAAKQTASLASAKVWVGNASGIAVPVSLSGDATIDNTGAVTIANSAVTDAKVAAGIAATKIGGGAVDNTEYSYLDGVTSAIQTQLAAKISNTLASGKILVGNASNLSEAVDMSGDATISNTGSLTLASTITAGSGKGLSNKVPQITYDAKGRLTTVTEVTIDDTTKLPLAGGTLTGTLSTGNITMAANKYFGLSANSTDGTAAGQMWYDSGVIKYFDGSTVKSLGVAGAGITSMNGLSAATQTFAIGTSGTAPAYVSATSTHTLNIPMASAGGTVTAGLLSNAEYVTLNAKQDTSLASAKLWVGNGSGVAAPVSLSGDATIANTGAITVDKSTTGTSSKILALDGSGVATVFGTSIKGVTAGTATIQASANFTNYALTLPVDDGTSGQVLSTDGSGVLSWVNALTNNLTSAKILVGNASNLSAAVSLSGDATIDNVGVLTLKNTGTAGTYGSASQVPIITTDSQGRVTGATTAAPVDATKLPLAGGSMNGDITMANQKAVMFSELTGGGANYAKIQAPAALSADYTLTLPTSAGSANQFLQTDGSGALTWATALTAVQNTAALTSAKFWVGNASTKAMEVSMSGDATMDNAGAVTLKNTGTAGTYYKVTTDAQGRVSSGSALVSGDITTALSYTPVNKAGDTMTGTLNLASNGLTVGTTQLVVSGGLVGIGQTPTTDKLEVNGNIRATAFLYTSDRRLKKDFQDLAGLETILRLHGVSFKWRETNIQEVGLIAQEVEAVLPELVQTDKVTGLKSVKYGNLVAPLIEATKELYGLCQETRLKVKNLELQQFRTIASVNVLEDKVRKLEEENTSLRKEVEEIKRLIKNRK